MKKLASIKKIPIPLFIAASLIFTAARLNAQNVISASFEGGHDCPCVVAGVAGVVPVDNWNNLPGASGSSGLIDDTGVATSASISWASTNTWSAPVAGTDPNSLMMSGYLDNDTFGTGITTVTMDNVPFTHYRVYIYFTDDNSQSGTIGSYEVNGVTIFGNEGGVIYNGAFKQASGTSRTSTAVGNYLVFDGLSSPSFKLTASPVVLRAPVNAIQIVAETTDHFLRPELTIDAASGQYTLRSLVHFNADSNGIDPASAPAMLQIGSSPFSIPAGSFVEDASGNFIFHGNLQGAVINAEILPTADGKGFTLTSHGLDPNLAGITSDPLPVTIIIGDDVATAEVTPVLN